MEYAKTAPQEERETIISYDALSGQWHFYSNEPKHIRKWSKFIKNVDCQTFNKAGQSNSIEGDLDSVNVIISKKQHRSLTSEQRETLSKRMKKLAQQRKERTNNNV